MSRNFELLTQIESEFGAKQDPLRTTTDRAAVPADLRKNDRDMGGEKIRGLVQSLFLSNTGAAPHQVVFCGVDEENGSSSVCANVGSSLAAAGSGSVCLVDANFHSPRLSGISRVNKAVEFPGKSASLRDQCLEIADNLWLFPQDLLAGDHGAFPSAARLKQILSELRGAFDFALIDAPGAGVSGDTAILGQVADGTVLVIEAGTTRRIAARKAKEALDAASVRILGTILQNRSYPIPEGLYRRL